MDGSSDSDSSSSVYDDKFKIFRDLMVDYKTQNVWFCTGSVAELPTFYVLMNPTDCDTMLCPRNIRALPSVYKIKRKVTNGMNILRIDTTNIQPGYTRLKQETGENYVYRGPQNHGPAHLRIMTLQSEPCDEEKVLEIGFDQLVLHKLTLDQVCAIHCPIWPEEAHSWLNRQRPSGWPNKELVDNIKSLGYHFVSKCYNSGLGDKSIWRFSFSVAELLLIRSWSPNQKYVYHLLRLSRAKASKVASMRMKEKRIQTKVNEFKDDAKLCSYYVKTLMLWSCESYSPECWFTENLPTTLERLLLTLIEWLIDQFVPNYFIPECNTLDCWPDDQYIFDDEIETLLDIAENKIDIIMSEHHEASESVHVYHTFKSIALFHSSMITNTTSTARESVLDLMLTCELHNLYRGMTIHARGSKNRNSVNDVSFRLAEAFYKKSREECNMKWLLNCDTSSESTFFDLFHNWFHLIATRFSGELRDCRMRNNSSSDDKPEMFVKAQEPQFSKNSNFYKFQVLIQMLIAGIEHLPKMSFFTCCALLANFYYTSKCYDEAYSVCTEALGRLDSRDIESYHFVIPVVIHEKWSAIFDDHLQTIIGFHVLARKLMQLQDPVVDRICPFLFMHYIQIKCRSHLTDGVIETIDELIGLFLEHQDSCFHENFCRLANSRILHAALVF